MRLLAFFLSFGIVLGVSCPGIGYRTLWADEQETAERGRSIVESGLPKVFDPNGNLSLNSGGREIEEGILHRYTPWLQFYTTALGLRVGRSIGMTPDASVRLPFVFLHSAASGLVAQGLIAGLSLGVAPAVGLAVLYGVGSVRLIHARTSRYHALTDFLFMAAWCLFGFFRRHRTGRGRYAAAVALGLVLVGLLHTQTLVGILGAAIFSILVLLDERISRKTLLLGAIIGLGTIALFALIRPWEQSAIWGAFGYRHARSLKSGFEVAYALIFFTFSFSTISGLRNSPSRSDGTRKELGLAIGLFLTAVLIIRILDFHPYSQVRYYLPIVGLFLFWPIALGTSGISASRTARRTYVALVFIAMLLPEFFGDFAAFQGLRIVKFDSSSAPAQPLREAVAEIDRFGVPGDGVLMDYTPQAVNWYLPQMKPALVPDPTILSPLGKKNRGLPPMAEPKWHIAFPDSRVGFWICDEHCDYTRINDPKNPDRYAIRSTKLGKTMNFCVQKRWRTYQWNNAPFVNYQAAALSPGGPPLEDLVLAKRCD